MNLAEYEVKACPSTIYYVPNFISREEETQILQAVSNAPKPKWTQLSNRRLINYGGIPHPKGMIAETLPRWLDQFVDRINRLDVFEPGTKANHVLVNEYLPGQGIMPHLDGPLFLPTITTISCGSHTVLEYFEQTEGEPTLAAGGPLIRQCVARLLIEPRSLLVVKHDMYHRYLHGIQEQDHDVIDERIVNLVTAEADGGAKFGDVLPRTTRLSLTIRHVPKTTKMKIKLF
ncbi:alpha-ketoglutarate-dependent dioxygenase alkB homolog 6 [Anopheles cruzii]|uniref:alpha-ketoglutarate-dependent dioxygenase alkB homolog 6 n=1 Tax=Anopheles cruzii TaxID=68878 RepID=UPI0022EC4697|nr:alpha-ketoglutarate-dependent dioxygenase alkB homolog 6 [Anopheles cruzii]